MSKQGDLPVRRVAIVGAGLIGVSWAALFTAGGVDVTVWDPSEAALEAFRPRMAAARRQLAQLGLRGRGKLRLLRRLSAAVKDADLVQENAPEKIDVKRRLYADIFAAAPDAIIASSTSSFAWSDLTQGVAKAAQVVVAHPFNPPHLVPLVEIFSSDDAVARRVMNFYRAMGKVPVRMKREAPGHIANRLASALYREAVNIVAEGIADVDAVDTALVEGPGLRWSIQGAHMTYHLGGGDGGIRHYLDHLGPSQEKRWASLGQPQLTPAVKDAIVRGVEAEAAGRSIAELSAERDAMLLQVLKLRARRKA